MATDLFDFIVTLEQRYCREQSGVNVLVRHLISEDVDLTLNRISMQVFAEVKGK
jgi:hypothetical protein